LLEVLDAELPNTIDANCLSAKQACCPCSVLAVSRILWQVPLLLHGPHKIFSGIMSDNVRDQPLGAPAQKNFKALFSMWEGRHTEPDGENILNSLLSKHILNILTH
jgi:hypothetical protein